MFSALASYTIEVLYHYELQTFTKHLERIGNNKVNKSNVFYLTNLFPAPMNDAAQVTVEFHV